MAKRYVLSLFLLLLGMMSLLAAEGGDPEKGFEVYLTNCMPCHGPIPSQDGPIGPAIKGASIDLITARVLFGNMDYQNSYPPGYRPKMKTNLMPPMPHLQAQLGDLAAYLNQ